MEMKIQREEETKKGLKLTFNSSKVPSPASLSLVLLRETCLLLLLVILLLLDPLLFVVF